MSVPPFKCRNSLIHTLAAPGIQESSSPHFFPLPLTRTVLPDSKVGPTY